MAYLNGAAELDRLHPITVERAIELPSVRRGLPQVLAGADQLHRTIRWVHVTEDPKVTNTLKGSELMLTTGMAFQERRRDAQRFVEQLGAQLAAGLVIELGKPLPTVPDWLVSCAASVELPLICLRREVAFVEITEEMHSEILSRQLSFYRHAAACQERFAALVVAGRDVTEILADLADLVGNPVTLEDHRGSLMFHSAHGLDDRDVVAAWETLREGSDTSATLSVPVPRSGLAAGGRLMVLAMQSPCSELDAIAVDRAAGVIALSLLRNHADQYVAARERGNFLVELIDQRLTPREAAIRARALGFESEGAQLLPVAVSLGGGSTPPSSDIWHGLQRELDSAGYVSMIGSHSRLTEMLFVVAMRSAAARTRTADHLATIVESIARRAQLTLAPVVAVADVCAWETLASEIEEACRTADGARTLAARPWHDAGAPDLERLLSSISELPEVQTFAIKRLAPLEEQDRRRNTTLIETLEAFCECGGRKTAAAEILHLRRQALHYRLTRIEEVLGIDLDDENARLGLHLALRVRRCVARAPR